MLRKSDKVGQARSIHAAVNCQNPSALPEKARCCMKYCIFGCQHHTFQVCRELNGKPAPNISLPFLLTNQNARGKICQRKAVSARGQPRTSFVLRRNVPARLNRRNKSSVLWVFHL